MTTSSPPSPFPSIFAPDKVRNAGRETIYVTALDPRPSLDMRNANQKRRRRRYFDYIRDRFEARHCEQADEEDVMCEMTEQIAS